MAWDTENTELHTWFERDRAHVDLREAATGRTIAEWWDDAVAEAIEDGFLSPRDFHGSAVEYANERGLIVTDATRVREDYPNGRGWDEIF